MAVLRRCRDGVAGKFPLTHCDPVTEAAPADVISHLVPIEAAGERVDRFLAACHPEFSRSQIQRAAEAGMLRVDGRAVRSHHRLREGETIELMLARPEPDGAPPAAEKIDLDIVYEDEFMLVINKPAGMVVHPAVGNRSGTLVNALLGRGVFHDGDAAGSPARPGIVHRLDKGTSGLIVCARTESAHRQLAEQLKQRTLKRVYWALSWGHLRSENLAFDGAIGRSRTERKKMAVTSSGRVARTDVRVIEGFELADWLEITLATGRTHQIRVHLSHAGHPIVGDDDYGGGPMRLRGIDPTWRLLGRRMLDAIARPALHARLLSLEHPVTGKPMDFSVEPPEDFTRLVGVCRLAVRS